MSDQPTYVIAGAGLAGAKAAGTLREEGFDGRLVLVGAEAEQPYERPPLSKAYLRGESERAEAHVHAAGFYAEHGIELRSGVTATGLDASAHRLSLADGSALDYDRLLIATGAVPRRPPIAGAELDGVHVLRTLAEADALRARLQRGASVGIIGAGWIGCEVAAAARARGAQVTLIEAAEQPLERVLGAQLGAFFAGVHRDHGVRVLTGAGVERIEGAGRVERVLLADGTAIDCSCVVLGVGVKPDTRLAEAAGLEIGDGVLVDERLRTSAPDVLAAGDVAAAFHPRYGRHIRVEHWANALNQGIAAGRSMLGAGEPYDRLPYFFSDQYDVGMEYAGLHAPGDRLEVQGALASGKFRALWRDADDRVVAGLHVNDWGAIDEIKEVIEAQTPSTA